MMDPKPTSRRALKAKRRAQRGRARPEESDVSVTEVNAVDTLVNINPDDFITIKTPSGGKYMVLGSRLSACSEYFKRAMSGPWIESGSKEVNLDEDVADDVVTLVKKWIYTQKLTGEGANAHKPATDIPWIRLCDALIFAHYFLMPKLEADLLELMDQKVEMSTELIHISPRIWTETPDDGKIWEFFIDLTSNLKTAKRISKKSVKQFTQTAMMMSYQKLVENEWKARKGTVPVIGRASSISDPGSPGTMSSR